eukprot:2404524-Rhodomonas_salina.2
MNNNSTILLPLAGILDLKPTAIPKECIEGAVLITKEHMLCLMKTANTPAHFWPWALKHFCSISLESPARARFL